MSLATSFDGSTARTLSEAPNPFPNIDEDEDLANVSVLARSLLASKDSFVGRRLMRRDVPGSGGDDGADESTDWPGDEEQAEEFSHIIHADAPARRTPQVGGSRDARSSDATPGDAMSGDARPGDVRSSGARPGDARSGDAMSSESNSSEANSDEANARRSIDARPRDARSRDAVPDAANNSSVHPSVWMPLARAAGWAPRHERTSRETTGGMGYHQMPGTGVTGRFSIHPATMQSSSDQDYDWDGRVKVKKVEDSTEELMIREQNAKCLLMRPVFECMHEYGSYGINRMYTETAKDIEAMEWEQASWMENPAVQRQRLFDLTLPMSRSSASYDVASSGFLVGQSVTASIITQTLDVYQQLQLGVRALDVPIAVKIADNQLWATWGLPNVLLTRVLKDVRQFLQENEHEVIILSVRHATLLDDNVATVSHELLTQSTGVLPGEGVHMQVGHYLGRWLGTYEKLAGLSAPRQNPVIAEMVQSQARLLYFWEGQQVLC